MKRLKNVIHGSTVTQSLPRGTHYALTAGVTGDFGGMTHALLRRSRCFHEETGESITILTYNHKNYDDARKDLRARDLLVDGLTLINLFEDMEGWSEEKLNLLSSQLEPTVNLPHVFPVELKDTLEVITPEITIQEYHRKDGSLLCVEKSFINPNTNKKFIVYVDHYRPDSSLLTSEYRNVNVLEENGNPLRHYVLFNRMNKPLGSWPSEGDILRFWLDTLPRDPIAWLIVDSKEAGKIIAHYQRPDVVTMFVTHSTHLVYGRPDRLNFRKYTMERLDNFDAAIFLTETQLKDVGEFLGPGIGNRYAIGNLCNVLSEYPKKKRNKNRGIMIGRLDRGKQTDHGIEAVGKNLDVVNPFNRPHLALYGATEKSKVGEAYGKMLKSKVKTINRKKRIVLLKFLSRFMGDRLGWFFARAVYKIFDKPAFKFHGYKSNARRKYETAGFSMLTSRTEGFGLVVVESMGRGCIPICYDISYGPKDIITDGVNGFLVRQNDKVALAKAVRKVITLSKVESEAMSRAAFDRAQDFNGKNITDKWIETMELALARKLKTLK